MGAGLAASVWFPYMGNKLILEQEGLAAVALIHSDLYTDSFARLKLQGLKDSNHS